MRILLFVFCSLWSLSTLADDFAGAEWIGHMTRQEANIPQGRNFTGAKLKEPAVKAAWAAVKPESDRSIFLRRDIRLQGKVKQATIYICGLGFYELTMNGQKIGDAEFAPLWSDYDKSVFYNTSYNTSLHECTSWQWFL